MKKILLLLSATVLLAAGCGSSVKPTPSPAASQPNTQATPAITQTTQDVRGPAATAPADGAKTPGIAPNPPANSKLYTNSTLNFQVEVPNEYKYKEMEPLAKMGGAIIFGITDPNNKYNKAGFSNYQFQIGVYEQPYSSSDHKIYTNISDFVNAYFTTYGGMSAIPSYLTLTKTSFAENPAVIITGNSALPTPAEMVGFQDIFIMYNGLIYEINYNPAGSTLYSQVLSSFKFTK